MNRRGFVTTAALLAAGCEGRDAVPLPPAQWVGASFERGHRLRSMGALPAPAVHKRAAVLIVGGGIAGLAAARGFMKRGIDDVHLLELEDSAGGNSRGHVMGGMACPLGAHYLPLPAPESHEVAEWLHELGLLKHEFGRSVPEERHLCHSPQERLFFEGAWVEGLLPPTAAEAAKRFAHITAPLQNPRSFALPAHRGAWRAEHEALNRVTFARWLDEQQLADPALRWYLDYCCRDDFGAGITTVSAWAGMHYFASRHGFHAPGEEAERDGVFTWPEGNAWLAQRLMQPLGERVHGGRTVLRVSESRHEVQVLAWDEAAQQVEAWTAPQAVLALPLFVAARVLESPPQALRDAAALMSYAPWLVANLQLDAPLLDRASGAPPSWDNVVYGASGLGYVDAMHQSLRATPGPTVLTAYRALQAGERAALLNDTPAVWADRVLADLQPAHPDIRRRVQRIDLMRWGHAMAVPRPGVHRHPALAALRAMHGRMRFAHADLAGYSVFEEAFTAGCEAAA